MGSFEVGSFSIGNLFVFCLCLWCFFKAGFIKSSLSLVIWFLVILVWTQLAIYFFPQFRGLIELMSVLDIVILLFVCVGIWRGFNVGLIQSLVSLIGWFIAVFLGSQLAIYIGPPLSVFVENNFLQESSVLHDNPVLQMALGFLVIVLVIFTMIQLIAHLMKKVVKAFKLKWLDQLSGAFLGGIRNILVLLAVLNLTAPMIVTLPLWHNSVLTPKLLPYAPLAQRTIQDTFGLAWEQLTYGVVLQHEDDTKK